MRWASAPAAVLKGRGFSRAVPARKMKWASAPGGVFSLLYQSFPGLRLLALHGEIYCSRREFERGSTPMPLPSLADSSQEAWEQAVSDGVRKVTTNLTVDTPDDHTLKIRMV